MELHLDSDPEFRPEYFLQSLSREPPHEFSFDRSFRARKRVARQLLGYYCGSALSCLIVFQVDFERPCDCHGIYSIVIVEIGTRRDSGLADIVRYPIM